MARCGSCNKFVSFDTTQEPDVTSDQLSFSTTADYDIDVTIENNCGECGDTLRTAELNTSDSFDIDIDEYEEDDRDNWTIEVEVSRSERSEGKGRGLKMFYGFEGTVKLMDGNGNELESREIGEDIQSSHMDEY